MSRDDLAASGEGALHACSTGGSHAYELARERCCDWRSKPGPDCSGGTDDEWVIDLDGKEMETIRLLFPFMTYADLAKHLPGRSWHAVRSWAQKMGLTIKRHVWTGAEITKLRRLYQHGTMQEVRDAFPGFSDRHLCKIANNHRMARPRRRFKSTGVGAIDQIRDRAFDLGYSMPDVDELAHSKKYFQQGQWHAGVVKHKAIARAIAALDGNDIRYLE
jgi:hypothetical protein